MSLRILNGKAKNRLLKVPESARPTGIRIRKSLFDLLEFRKPAEDGYTFIDLHAGSGAIAFEAASRGYKVSMIEKESRAVKTLEQNAKEIGLYRDVKIIKGDSRNFLNLGTFDIVFSDPPYDQDIQEWTNLVLNSNLIAENGLFISQHEKRDILDIVNNNFARETRIYGSNVMDIFTRL